jgi:hypothetical protein
MLIHSEQRDQEMSTRRTRVNNSKQALAYPVFGNLILSELDSNFDSKAREKLLSLTIQSEHEMA